jgi:hypothetical protein
VLAKNGRLIGVLCAGVAAFLPTFASLEWPDLLDAQWRTRGQLAWYLEVGKSFLPFLVGALVAVVVARLTRLPRNKQQRGDMNAHVERP